MAAEKKEYALDLFKTLESIDRGHRDYYANLSDREKKGYVPLVLMRYLSSLPDQNNQAADAVIMTNDIVNNGFWELSKHPELQHKLLCVVGVGKRQVRPWIAKKKLSKTPRLDDFFQSINNSLNDTELEILKNSHDYESIKQLAVDLGMTDSQIKVLTDEYRKKK